jgi:anti-sigma B factor antagonist
MERWHARQASEIARTALAEIPSCPATDPGCMSAAEPTLIAPEGDLDIASVGDLRAALSAAAREGAGAVIVDLSQVTFIDSSGLGALVELHRRLRRSGRRLVVVAPGGSAPAVLLDLAGLRGRLPISETRRGALDA